MAYLTNEEIIALGFKKFGSNILISDKCSIYGASNIELESNIRIDDFCVLSAGEGGIKIGSYVHIATQSSLIGNAKIILEDFVGISSKVSIFSSSDDYLGYGLANPMVPDEFKRVTTKAVVIEKHGLIGANSVILPGVTIREGASVGAMSLVNKSLDGWFLYSGHPIEKKVRRSKKMLEKEVLFLKSIK